MFQQPDLALITVLLVIALVISNYEIYYQSTQKSILDE